MSHNSEHLRSASLNPILSAAQADPQIERVYLFGSRARGTANAFSDVDIAIICTDPAQINRVALNIAAETVDAPVSFTYIQSDTFQTDDHPLHVSSSVKKEGILLWQK